jgi:hypothetical protein
VWLKTETKEVMTTAIEVGLCSTLLFEGEGGEQLAFEWANLARFSPVYRNAFGVLKDGAGGSLGTVVTIAEPKDLNVYEKGGAAAAVAAATEGAGASFSGYVLVEFEGVSWQVLTDEASRSVFRKQYTRGSERALQSPS